MMMHAGVAVRSCSPIRLCACRHSVCLSEDGACWGWGWAEMGALGNPANRPCAPSAANPQVLATSTGQPLVCLAPQHGPLSKHNRVLFNCALPPTSWRRAPTGGVSSCHKHVVHPRACSAGDAESHSLLWLRDDPQHGACVLTPTQMIVIVRGNCESDSIERITRHALLVHVDALQDSVGCERESVKQLKQCISCAALHVASVRCLGWSTWLLLRQ